MSPAIQQPSEPIENNDGVGGRVIYYHFRRVINPFVPYETMYVLFGGKHGRERYGTSIYGEDLLPHGGITVAASDGLDGVLRYGVSVCSENDVYNKNIGRVNSLARLVEALNTNNLIVIPNVDQDTELEILACLLQLPLDLPENTVLIPSNVNVIPFVREGNFD